MAMKRKTDVDKEERRRQEILAKRREEIRLATERFQRLNKNYVPKTAQGNDDDDAHDDDEQPYGDDDGDL